ncbi:26S proteasome non-ATPase regulatory subunit 12 [Trachymyrmex septentrionalis]|uniref:26S proteasome non-ATPase regulatory subunit 12 n=1 Tax=Trachymyrmex septentrionalis TaxID=34720 RepID=A0A151JYU3_9HYME|nr:PREDICTED: 26S proteasome non-ATPase regulatory subunit 12 [Trachymyrmex septentrionalis]XP_018338873.1 PREDICTED: 26S proteasome non-ATPase regulatory subunit 12 [Trachymyrmex septentrionalis]XP_018338874.1 PREDICTED: 26S proteasome non-ATPase regulatory subunit 12 [Trachymyrmex septentrionalis]KYN41608.1 26S proteasome non-ATPase regulatory subunit 12 [Trachymyrmex septentrionalis]
MAEAIMDNSGRLMKMEVDYSNTCDTKIPECKKLASEGKLHDALDQLLALEKLTRTVADMASTSRLLIAIVEICLEAKNWSALNEHIILLSKRRSQLKQAVTKMVQECCTYIDKMPNKETMVKLIETLRLVTEGKIYVEVERARLTHRLAEIKEAEGDIAGAAAVMLELQVETYGSMSRREKASLILEQMRLCLAKQDFMRTQIIAKKINVKFFSDENDEETQTLKLKYYDLMMELARHEGWHLELCRHNRAVLETPTIRDDPEKRRIALSRAVLYLVLAPHEPEQADLTHRLLADKLLDEIPTYKELLRLFVNPELIKWSGLCEIYEKDLRLTEVFSSSTEEGCKRWTDLRNRVVEHNIRIMAKYYTKITLTRMAELLDLPTEETEACLCNLVETGVINARTNRPAGVVRFTGTQEPAALLDTWAASLSKLMGLVNHTTHLIHQEEMLAVAQS